MVSPFVATHYCSYLPQPYIHQLRLNLIFGKIIWMSIQHMLLDQHVSMITFILHETFLRFGCVLEALQWLSLKKGIIMTNDVFHHFCHLHVNYKVLVMKEKKCWLNNVCTRAWHSKTLIYATWMNTKPSMLLILCYLHFVPTQGLVAFLMKCR
jgi:hypothetical protein